MPSLGPGPDIPLESEAIHVLHGDVEMSGKGPQIAAGRLADVYAWGDRHILKLYRHGCSPTVADREAAGTRMAHAAGIPTPAVLDVTRVEDRVGLILERIDGPTMLQALCERPESAHSLAHQLATLAVHLHSCGATNPPSQRQLLQVNIGRAKGLTEDMKAEVLHLLGLLPDANSLCHGDFHPGNVIMTTAGPVIIDWLNATRGNPIADVARTTLLCRHTPLPENLGPEATRILDVVRPSFEGAYFRQYEACALFPMNSLTPG